MATSKPDIMIILLSKLMEEGDMFYKVRRVGLERGTDATCSITWCEVLAMLGQWLVLPSLNGSVILMLLP